MGDMAVKKAARNSGNCSRAKVSVADTQIVADGWTRAQCRAIEIGLGGGFIALALLEAVFGW